jgi:hypothetical protein
VPALLSPGWRRRSSRTRACRRWGLPGAGTVPGERPMPSAIRRMPQASPRWRAIVRRSASPNARVWDATRLP